jgi:hypothetical protein
MSTISTHHHQQNLPVPIQKSVLLLLRLQTLLRSLLRLLLMLQLSGMRLEQAERVQPYPEVYKLAIDVEPGKPDAINASQVARLV